MSFIAKKGSSFAPVPVGIHLARCYQVISLGVQTFKDSSNPKLWLGFELPDVEVETQVGKRPATCGKEFALYLGPKSKLQDALQGWRGLAFTKEELEGFDVSTVAGQLAQLSVKFNPNDNTKTVIDTINGLTNAQRADVKSGKIVKKTVNPICIYDPDNHDEAMWQLVPPFLQRKIGERVIAEKKQEKPAAKVEDFDDDLSDVPF